MIFFFEVNHFCYYSPLAPKKKPSHVTVISLVPVTTVFSSVWCWHHCKKTGHITIQAVNVHLNLFTENNSILDTSGIISHSLLLYQHALATLNKGILLPLATCATVATNGTILKQVGNVALAFLVAPGEISQITWRLLSLTSRVSNIVRFLFPVTQS